MNHNAHFLRGVYSGIDIRTDRVIASEAVNAVRDQQNLASSTGRGPTFDQVHDRKIDAGICSGISERHSQGLGHGFVVLGKLGSRLDRAIAGVEHADVRRLRLCCDKIPQIAQLTGDIRGIRVVDDDSEEKSSLIALRRNPVGHFSLLFPLIDVYIGFAQRRRRSVLGTKNGDVSGDRHIVRGCRLVLSVCREHADHQNYEN